MRPGSAHGTPFHGVEPLATVTLTVADVFLLAAASRATAVSECAPFAAFVVSHATAYGDAVSSVPRATPSTKKFTPATPTLSDAFAVTCTVPLTVAPATGAVMATDGAVVSDAASSV